MVDGSDTAAGRDRTAGIRRHRAWVVIGVVIGLALLLVLVAALMAPDRANDIWVEIAKSSLYLTALAVTGGIVAIVVRDRDAAREDARRRDAFRLAFLDEVEAAWTQIKAARRLLRTYGFDAPGDAVLGAEEVSGFRTQMAALNDAELALELFARRVRVLPDRFGPNAPVIAQELHEVHASLRRVLFEFESDPRTIAVGGSTAAVMGWPHFVAFTAYDEDSKQAFEEGVAGRIARIEELLLG